MTLFRCIYLIISLLTFTSIAAQERTLYYTYDGRPVPADSAQRIRKGTFENGKWHVLDYEKFILQPLNETWYLDSNFQTRDGAYTGDGGHNVCGG